MDNPINVGLKDADYERYFGCARCFVWAIVIEVGLLIGWWLCWCLLFTPRQTTVARRQCQFAYTRAAAAMIGSDRVSPAP
jgi:hypothetical protein